MGIIVVKCGGNAAVRVTDVCDDVAAVHAAGVPVVLVHGGSADIDQLAGRLGIASRRLVAPDGVSTRYTDADTMQAVHLALAGITKPRIIAGLAQRKVPAVGLTGADANLLRVRDVPAVRAIVDGRRTVVRDNLVGRITGVDTRLLHTLLAAGIVPVLSPPALTGAGEFVNVDADRVAAAVAAALGATDLVLLTGAPGLLRDPTDPGSLLATHEVDSVGTPSWAGGGMALKLVAAREALLGGVARVMIGSGAVSSPVRAALAGRGTRVSTARGLVTAQEGRPA